MSLKEASFKVHHFAQNVFPCPYFVDIKQDAIIHHPKYNRKHHKFYRKFIFVGAVIGFPITLFYLLWLLINHKTTFKMEYMTQYFTYTILTSMFIVFNYCNYLMIATIEERLYVVTQACKLYKQKNCSIDFIKLGKFTIQEIFIYLFAFAFLFIAIAVFIAPFPLSLDPIQLVLGASLPVKFFCSLLYGPGSAFLLWYLLSTFLITIASLEMGQVFSKGLVVKLTEPFLYKNITSVKFNNCYIEYLKTRLLFDLSAIVAKKLPAIIIIIGILLCSVTITGTLILWDKVNIFVYLCLPTGSALCLSIAIVFTNVAGIPYKNARNFKKFWNGVLYKKLDRRVIRSVRHFGFDCGPYGICTQKLGPTICEDMISNAADLLLIM